MQNYKTGALEIANYRISKSAWLHEHEHKHVEAVSRRVEQMTSMTVDTAEELQVVNYGIGGHYEPHFDFARVSQHFCVDALSCIRLNDYRIQLIEFNVCV